MTPYATSSDLQGRWPSRTLTGAELSYADVLLARASREVRRDFPRTDQRIASGELDVDDVVDVVCDMVKAAIIGESQAGVEQTSQTIGPFSTSQRFSNPNGDLYFTQRHRRILGGPQASAFTVRPQFEPDCRA